MPASHPSSTPAPTRARARSEGGLGLVEIMVVLLIVMVLMAIAISGFRGTKRTNHYRAAQAAASTYSEAIESYMADNGQRPPAMGTEWPTASREQRIGGPVDVMLKTPDGNPKRYMPRAAPEAVLDGLVDVVGAGQTPSATAHAWITYSVSGSDYVLRVTARAKGSDPVMECVITNGATLPSGVGRCP